MREGRQKEVYLKKKNRKKQKINFFKEERLIKKIFFFPSVLCGFLLCVCLPPESLQVNRVLLLSSSHVPHKTDLMGIKLPGAGCF